MNTRIERKANMSDENYIIYLENKVEHYRQDFNTGLYGRKDFQTAISKCFSAGEEFRLTMYDVNGLHEVNRIHGWEAGDELLKSVAEEIKKIYESHETYIIGGDEFMTIFKNNVRCLKVKGATCATVDSKDFTSAKEMLNTVDRMMSANKKKLNRRRKDI